MLIGLGEGVMVGMGECWDEVVWGVLETIASGIDVAGNPLLFGTGGSWSAGGHSPAVRRC